LKISKLLNTNTEGFRLFHKSLERFLGQQIFEAVGAWPRISSLMGKQAADICALISPRLIFMANPNARTLA
jgi:hypothetical protein